VGVLGITKKAEILLAAEPMLVLKVVLVRRLVVVIPAPVPVVPEVLAPVVRTKVMKVGLVRGLVGLLKLRVWPKPRSGTKT
jgi:hypothetical protein